MKIFVNDRLSSLISLMSAVLLMGTAGYALIEGWQLMDGLYMTLITISTVGYGEIQELSVKGRVFTSILIVISMVAFVYWTAGVTSLLVSGDLNGVFRKKKELAMIAKLKKHVVVCGGGVMARTVIAGLTRESQDIVVITNSEETAEQIRRLYPQAHVIVGDPKCEMTLSDANILQAKHLVAAMEEDYDNLLITISAAALGTGIKVYSCAINNELASRLIKVGAERVICPMVLGGNEITSLISDHSA